MRKALLLSAVLLLSTAALADDRGTTRLSVMATDISYSWSENTGSRADAGAVVALSHRFGEKWGLEASYGFERGYDVSRFDFERVAFNVHPLDVVGQFFIPTGESRWKPYVGAGARYTATPEQSLKSHAYSETNAQINAGSILNLTPRVGIRFDGKFLVGGNNARWDEPLKFAVGLSFRF